MLFGPFNDLDTDLAALQANCGGWEQRWPSDHERLVARLLEIVSSWRRIRDNEIDRGRLTARGAAYDMAADEVEGAIRSITEVW